MKLFILVVFKLPCSEWYSNLKWIRPFCHVQIRQNPGTLHSLNHATPKWYLKISKECTRLRHPSLTSPKWVGQLKDSSTAAIYHQTQEKKTYFGGSHDPSPKPKTYSPKPRDQSRIVELTDYPEKDQVYCLYSTHTPSHPLSTPPSSHTPPSSYHPTPPPPPSTTFPLTPLLHPPPPPNTQLFPQQITNSLGLQALGCIIISCIGAEVFRESLKDYLRPRYNNIHNTTVESKGAIRSAL